MDTSQDAFNQLTNRLRDQVPGSLQVKKINPFVFGVDLTDHHLIIFYYFPGGVRIKPDCIEKRCIHLDQDIWLNKTNLVLDRILSMIGQAQRFYARQAVVARIDKKTTLDFLEEHHLHIPLPGKYRYGLFFKGELMSICIFSGARVMRHTEGYRSFECIRFCTKRGYIGVGGLSKLLKAFYRDFKPSDLMTYIDLDWSDGDKYEKIGFEKVGFLKPQYYLVNRTTHQRTPYKSDANKALDIKKNKELYIVANCGSLKMIKTYSD